MLSPGAAYLRLARELTTAHGALLVVDEIQTGIGRTGTWFAFQQAGIQPDAITVAKGLGGGVPIGALVAFGPRVSGLLTAGQHGSTFGGNPLAAAAGLAVLETIESQGLLDHVREMESTWPRRSRRSATPSSPACAARACCGRSPSARTSPLASPSSPARPASSSTR